MMIFDDHLLRFLCTFNINGMRSILPVYLLSNEFPVIISVFHHPSMTFLVLCEWMLYCQM